MNYLLPAFSGSNLYGSPSVADINQRPYSLSRRFGQEMPRSITSAPI